MRLWEGEAMRLRDLETKGRRDPPSLKLWRTEEGAIGFRI